MPEHHHSGADIRAGTRVAVIIPILNEARTLGRTLSALLNQDYPHELLEVLVVDSGSTDDWQRHLQVLENERVSVRKLISPRQNTSAAVNFALSQTDAPKALWISGHCILSPTYISELVAEADRYEDMVPGGMMEVTGSGFAGTINSLILKSRFGTGAAHWRFRRTPGWVDSATFALFDRAQLQSLGGLDEQPVRNQDNELMARLRRNGTKFRLVTATATYVAPHTFRGFWRRAWGNGAWGIWGWRLGWKASSWYHFAPIAALFLGVALLLASFWSPIALITFAGLACLYGLIAVSVSIGLAVRSRCYWTMLPLPFFIFIHHAIYGAGAWSALLRPLPIAADSDSPESPSLTPNDGDRTSPG